MTDEELEKRRKEREMLAQNRAAKFLAMRLKAGLQEMQILEEIIKDGTYRIQLEAAGGAYGRKQLYIYSKLESVDDSKKRLYNSDIYDTLSGLLARTENDILNGIILGYDPGRCHKCMEPNFVGESNLETWLILGGTTYCYRKGNIVITEARKRGKNEDREVLFFISEGLTLEESLKSMNSIMDEYDLSQLKELLDFYSSPSEQDIQKKLVMGKK